MEYAMKDIIKQFNLLELAVIAPLSLVIGIACIGIYYILIGDPIYNATDWVGVVVMLGACAVGTIAITKDLNHRR